MKIISAHIVRFNIDKQPGLSEMQRKTRLREYIRYWRKSKARQEAEPANRRKGELTPPSYRAQLCRELLGKCKA